MPIQTMLLSWQLEQPAVMPEWICAPLGAGEAKAVPGAVRVALAGMRPLGVLARWQDSQLVPLGMWLEAPAGLVGGMPTMRLMPMKLAEAEEGRWQATQLLVMPAWFMSEPEKRAPLATGRAEMEEPAPTWQSSQEAEVGMWFEGRPTMEKLAAGMAKEAAEAPWHWAQLEVVLGALAWMAARVGMTA
jgi:hypothetical protein